MLLQHTLNPLHVYCRLCDTGFPRAFAVRISPAYERFYRFFGLRG